MSRIPVRTQLYVLVALLVLVAFTQRWAQDDAYVTFRYSKHVVDGLGPVWNRDYAVEGYTDFLWMVCVAVGLKLGLSAEAASYAFSLPSFAIPLLIVFDLGRRVLPNERWALLATWLSGTTYSFLMYATGGLETQLHAMLVLGIIDLVLRTRQEGNAPPKRMLGLSLLMALALMARPDSVVPSAIAGGFVLFTLLFPKPVAAGAGARANPWLSLACLILPAVALVLPWLLWKLSFYGDIVPNTFYTKLGLHRSATLVRGAVYVSWLFISYWWLPLIVLIAIRARKLLLSLVSPLFVLIVYAGAWLGYVTWVGGDLMEFRLLTSVIPIVILLMLAVFSATAPSPRLTAALVVVMLLGSVSHGLAFPKYVNPRGIDTIPGLQENAAKFREVGERLGADLRGRGEVTIAVSPAGFIPYFSEARTIDVLGLNDRWVSREGFVRTGCNVCLGHARLATFAYMNQSGVNLILAHPQWAHEKLACARRDDIMKGMLWGEPIDYQNLPPATKIVAVPLSAEPFRELIALYSKPQPGIDALIASGTWRVLPECSK